MNQAYFLPHTGNPVINQETTRTFFQAYNNLQEQWPWQDPIAAWVDYILGLAANPEASTVFLDPNPQGGGSFQVRVDGLVLPGPYFSAVQYDHLLSAIQARIQFSQFVVGQQLQEGFILTDAGQRHWVGILQTAFGPQVTICFAHQRSADPLRDWPEQAKTVVEQMQRHGMGLIVCCRRPSSLSQQSTIFDIFDAFSQAWKTDGRPDARIGVITEGLQALPPHENLTSLCVDGSQQSWAQATRALIAQDIDLVMMRGQNDTAVLTQAVLTALEGRFVLADVSHQSVLDTLEWLLTELPMSAKQVASVLLGIVGSYPALRRVCPHCVVEQRLEGAVLTILNQQGLSVTGGTWVQGQGCAECYGTGYKQPRLTAVEALYIDPSLAKLCMSRPSREQLSVALADRGYQTYFAQAYGFAQQGMTTLTEAVRFGLARQAGWGMLPIETKDS